MDRAGRMSVVTPRSWQHSSSRRLAARIHESVRHDAWDAKSPTSWPSLSANDIATAADVARLLANPTPLRVLDYLSREGGATVSELAAVLGLAGPRLSNHLAKLRSAGVVEVHRHGRQATYQMTDPAISDIIAALLSVRVDAFGAARPNGRRASAGGVSGQGVRAGSSAASAGFRDGRTCYDHLAGRLGVRLLHGLQAREALGPAVADGESIALGPAADEVFERLGVDVASLAGHRRRVAFPGLDTTERVPHLGGALGAAVLSSLVDAGWVHADLDSRMVTLTAAGRQGLARELQVMA